MHRSRFVQAGLFLAFASRTWAGALVDLRPDIAQPPGGYAPNTVVNYDVFFVDTGSPQGDILFRGILLDFSDTSSSLIAGPLFNWVNPNGQGAVFPDLPFTSWVFPFLKPHPESQLTLPDGGEVLIGDVNVNVGGPGVKMLNLMNSNEADPNFGARAEFGFGFPGDPLVIWRAATGDLTGGIITITVVPEPATLVLFLLSVTPFVRRMRQFS